ncbi:hypothetical protein BH10PSE17_BH10PSE17_03470 [soil metagenome]
MTIIRSFDQLVEAEAARQALLAAGASPDEVEITITEHETGPAQGNWVTGDGRKEEGAEPGHGEEADYDANYHEVAQRSVCLLVLSTVPEREAGHVVVLDGFDCRDPEAAARAAT